LQRPSVRIAVAAALAGAAAFAVWKPLDGAFGRSTLDQLASLGPALGVALLVYFGAARALRVREMQALLSLRSRFRSV